MEGDSPPCQEKLSELGDGQREPGCALSGLRGAALHRGCLVLGVCTRSVSSQGGDLVS